MPGELGSLRHLRVLDLSRNQLSGWVGPWVGWLGALQRLSVNHNKLGGPLPDGLGRLHHLEYLHVQHNRFEGGLSALLFATMSPSLREVKRVPTKNRGGGGGYVTRALVV